MSPGAAAWVSAVTICPLQIGDCTHPREVRGYQPSRALRHLICIRQATCSYPGCRNPATRGDLDHTTAHQSGGKTCECNLAPLCRHHHGTKQTPGWTLAQYRPGTMIWTTPGGRSYTTHPTSYLG